MSTMYWKSYWFYLKIYPESRLFSLSPHYHTNVSFPTRLLLVLQAALLPLAALLSILNPESYQKCTLIHWVIFYLEPSHGPQLPQHKCLTPRSSVPLSPLCFYLLLSSQFNSSSHTNYPSVAGTWRACSCCRDVALAVHLPEMATSQISSQLLPPCLSSICSNVTFSWTPPWPLYVKVQELPLYLHSWCPLPAYFSPYIGLPLLIFSIIFYCCCLPPSTGMQAQRGQRCWLIISWLYPQKSILT